MKRGQIINFTIYLFAAENLECSGLVLDISDTALVVFITQTSIGDQPTKDVIEKFKALFESDKEISIYDLMLKEEYDQFDEWVVIYEKTEIGYRTFTGSVVKIN